MVIRIPEINRARSVFYVFTQIKLRFVTARSYFWDWYPSCLIRITTASIARVIEFFAGPLGAFVTGQALRVDGGLVTL